MRRLSPNLLKSLAIKRLAPGAEYQIIGGEIIWQSPSIQQPTDPEIEAEVAVIQAEINAPRPDWRGFLADLRGTTVFASLRGQARVDVAANALATELRTILGEAALGMAEPVVVQGLLDELLPSLSPVQVAEIDAAIAAHNIPLTTSP